MRVIKLDASGWKTVLDFYDALLPGLEAPHWHGRSVNALLDSMVYGQINGIDPPYKIWITGTALLAPAIRQEIGWMVEGIDAQKQGRVEIEFQIDP